MCNCLFYHFRIVWYERSHVPKHAKYFDINYGIWQSINDKLAQY